MVMRPRLHGTLAEVLDNQRRTLEEQVLPAWLAAARWFAGKGRTLARVQIGERVRLASDGEEAALLLLDVHYPDAGRERYTLLLAAAAPDVAAQLRAQAPQAVLAPLAADGGDWALVDGIYLPACARALLRLIRERGEAEGSAGRLLGRPGLALRELPAAAALPAPAVLTAEQSNTSVAFGQVLLLKQFRRLEEGGNPEAEMGRALTEKARFAAVAPYAGELLYRERDGGEQTLALLQGFVAHRQSGWDYAVAAVRDYIGRIPHQAEDAPRRLRSSLPVAEEDYAGLLRQVGGAVGADFTAMLERLGARTAELHAALAGMADPAFRPEPCTRQYQQTMLHASLSRVQQVSSLLRARLADLPGETLAAAGAVLGAETALREQLAALAVPPPAGQLIRIHGDYHLGQVLDTGRDLVITDFAGGPDGGAGERRAPHSPLRDVAGMLRSFRYAAAVGARLHPPADVRGHERRQPWLDAWGDCAGAVFVRAYRATVGVRRLLPAGADDCRRLLDWFMLDKALAEIAYELNHRPDWVAIPLAGLRDLLAAQGAPGLCAAEVTASDKKW